MGDDDWAVIAAGVGSPDASAGFDPSVVDVAVKALGQAMGIDITHAMAAEIGAGNSTLPLYLSACHGYTALDVAGSSRSVPSITMSSFAAAGVPVTQMMIANHDHQVGVTIETAAEAAAPMRAIISAPGFGQVAGIALWPMQGSVVKKHAVRGTFTMAQQLGAAYRKVHTAGGDVAAAMADAMGGRIIGHGTVEAMVSTTSGGFDFGRLRVKLDGGATLSVFNKNENLIAWSSERPTPLAIAPDLISYVMDDGALITNAGIGGRTGQGVSVIAAPADDDMRDPAIVAAFREALSSMGYPGPATPLGDL